MDVPRYLQHSSGFVLQSSTEGNLLGFGNETAKTTPTEHRFSPYDFNGGTVAAIAGENYVVVVSDTRLSSGYEILSRNVSKLHQLTSKCVLASSGCRTDAEQLRSWLDIKLKMYNFNHQKVISTTSMAQLLATTLYHKRFFPYYAFNVLAGLDENGVGAVYSYDAIGSFERVQYSAAGSGQYYIMPQLDNLVGLRNRTDSPHPLTAEEAVEILKDVFLSTGERDIYTGDSLSIMVITQDATTTSTFSLKAD